MHNLEEVYQILDFFVYKIMILFVLREKNHTYAYIHKYGSVKENIPEGVIHQYLNCYL